MPSVVSRLALPGLELSTPELRLYPSYGVGWDEVLGPYARGGFWLGSGGSRLAYGPVLHATASVGWRGYEVGVGGGTMTYYIIPTVSVRAVYLHTVRDGPEVSEDADCFGLRLMTGYPPVHPNVAILYDEDADDLVVTFGIEVGF